MPYGEAIQRCLFGVILPTLDIVTDWSLVFQLMAGTILLKVNLTQDDVVVYGFIYGLIAMAFPTLSVIFTIPHWLRMEKKSNGGSGRMRTLPLLLVWPQYRVLRMLYTGLIKKDKSWQEMKAELDQDVLTVEPFVEAVPQVFVVAIFWSAQVIALPVQGIGLNDFQLVYSWILFCTSVFSATNGITKFMKVGPFGVVPAERCTLSFPLIFLIILLSLITKGWLVSMAFSLEEKHYPRLLLLPSLLILPHLTFALLVMIVTL